MNPTRICSIDGCGRQRRYKMYCDAHRRRFKLYGDPLATRMPGRGKSPAERLDIHTDKSESCWIFTASGEVYGKLDVDGRSVPAHRLAYELKHGAIPAGQLVRHRCDTPRCVNPDHLILGTHADNSRDMTSRDRQAKGERQGSAKLTEADVLRIHELAATGEHRYVDLATYFGVSFAQIGHIVNGRRWKYLAPNNRKQAA